jgi:hypothetical protein
MAVTPPDHHHPDKPPPLTMRDKLIGTTPVVLSILATILAGLASREMTLAQYYRSMATQSQSKAGDQWSFFQAKRIRETNLRTTLDILEGMTPPEKLTPAVLREAAQRLACEFNRAVTEGEQLTIATALAAGQLGDARPAVDRAVQQVAVALQGKASASLRARKQILSALEDSKNQEAFEYLGSGKMPEIQRRTISDAALNEVVKAYIAGEPEPRLMELTRHVDHDVLEAALADATANLRDFEKVSEPVDQTLTALDRLITGELTLVRPLSRSLLELRLAVAAVPAGNDNKAVSELRAAAAALERTATGLKANADALYADIKAARHDYTARRYGSRGDAGFNRDVATLYEIQVRRLSIDSENHRWKSYFIFYCMLGAQVGVTIATLSLAMRRKGTLWTLAAVAGLTSLMFASYIFLGM